MGETGTAPPLVVFFEIDDRNSQIKLLDIALRSGFGLGHANI